MSGGSLNYLYRREPHDIATGGCDDYLETVRDTLLERDHIDAAGQVDALLATKRQFVALTQMRMDSLGEIMRAVEWEINGDSGVEVIDKAVEEWRAKCR